MSSRNITETDVLGTPGNYIVMTNIIGTASGGLIKANWWARYFDRPLSGDIELP
jgi:hypothetical protein